MREEDIETILHAGKQVTRRHDANASSGELESGGGATVLRDATMTVSDFDTFGNVRVVDVTTVGVDLTMHVERTFINDTAQWVLGQLQTLGAKDVRLAEDLARSHGVLLPLANAVKRRFEEAAAQGWADADIGAVVELLREHR